MHPRVRRAGSSPPARRCGRHWQSPAAAIAGGGSAAAALVSLVLLCTGPAGCAGLSIPNQALLMAVEQGGVSDVHDSLQEGADINGARKDDKPDGETALTIAALKGHVRVVDLLIKAGADVNIGALRARAPSHGHWLQIWRLRAARARARASEPPAN